MLPSTRLIVLLALAVPLLVLGGLYDWLATAAGIYLLWVGGCALLDAALLPRRGRFRIRRLLPDRISLGVPAPIRLEVEYQGWRAVRADLAEDLPEPLEADPPACTVTMEPGAARTAEYRLTARRRGRYGLEHLDVRAVHRGGLFVRQFRLPLASQLRVYPNLRNVSRYELLLRRGQTAEQGLARMRQIGQGTEFESLRPYAVGDPMARVEWKATAKRRQLVVKNYHHEHRQHVLIALDAGRATAGEFQGLSRLDYLVNAALMLAYVVLRQGDYYSLVAFSDRIETYLPPVRHRKSLERVAEALYELQPRLVESDYSRACRFLALNSRKRSLVCLMTDVIGPQASELIVRHMVRFARRHLPLAVALGDPDVRAVAEQPLTGADPYAKAVAVDVLNARAEALASMRKFGVDVLDVDPRQLTPRLIQRYLLIKSAHRL